MKLFSVGPVEMYPESLEIGGRQVPYFRNNEFSEVVKHINRMMKNATNAENESEVILYTCSGTGGLEAAVMNFFDSNDKVLVIDGGTFGHRFVELCEMHGIPHIVCKVPADENLTRGMLEKATGDAKISGLLVNIHETSIGKLYDKTMLSEFCKEKNALFVVDAISSFLADELDMKKDGIDLLITSSQKALALAPGLTILVAGIRALEKAKCIDNKTMYFELKSYLDNGKRGQTPFTPAIRVMYELEEMLERIEGQGVDYTIRKTAEIATDFRKKIKEIGLGYPSYNLSNFETPVIFDSTIASAKYVYERLITDYEIVVNPNGGELEDHMFRVGHIGNHTIEDNDLIIDAIKTIIGK